MYNQKVEICMALCKDNDVRNCTRREYQNDSMSSRKLKDALGSERHNTKGTKTDSKIEYAVRPDEPGSYLTI